jgi:hypothetical protein
MLLLKLEISFAAPGPGRAQKPKECRAPWSAIGWIFSQHFFDFSQMPLFFSPNRVKPHFLSFL